MRIWSHGLWRITISTRSYTLPQRAMWIAPSLGLMRLFALILRAPTRFWRRPTAPGCQGQAASIAFITSLLMRFTGHWRRKTLPSPRPRATNRTRPTQPAKRAVTISCALTSTPMASRSPRVTARTTTGPTIFLRS